MAPLNENEVAEAAVDVEDAEAVANEPVLTPEQKKERVAELLAEGRRDLRAQQLQDAADKFSDATELAVEVYGELAKECFDSYFLYGRALVELANVEDDMIKNATESLSKMKEGLNALAGAGSADTSMVTEEEAEKVREMVGDALEENAAMAEKAMQKDGNDEEAADDEKEEEKKEEAKPSDEDADEEGAEDEGEDEEDEEVEEEEMSSAQLAWEALEVAQLIASQQEDTADWKTKRADVMIQLAQCSIVDDKYTQAIEDLTKAAELLHSFVPEGDRLLAEVYLHMGRTHVLENEFTKAATAFDESVKQLHAYIEILKGKGDEAAAAEIVEMGSLAKEILARAEDARESAKGKEMMEKEKAKESAVPQPTTVSSSAASTDATVNDISGLVRKKRTLEEANDAEEPHTDTKKAKSESPEEATGNENVATV